MVDFDKLLVQAKINELSLKAVEIFKDFLGDDYRVEKNKFGIIIELKFKKENGGGLNGENKKEFG